MKLKEIAALKKVTLPEKPDEMTMKECKKLEGLAGAEFDRAYVTDSGVKGHELLHKTMTKVKKEAKDSNLQELESIAHPACDAAPRVCQGRDDVTSRAQRVLFKNAVRARPAPRFPFRESPTIQPTQLQYAG